MAIKPDELSRLQPQDLKAADQLERDVDDRLRTYVRAHGEQPRMEIPLGNLDNKPNLLVQQEVEGRYRAAGWREARFQFHLVDIDHPCQAPYWQASICLNKN